MTDQHERLARVLPIAGLTPTGEPTAVVSYSNDTWLIDDEQRGAVVLRVGWRGDTDRLIREGTVASALPNTVRYPTVLGFGRVPDDHGPDLTWTLTRRLAGTALLDAWPTLDEPTRRSACLHIAQQLKALHTWRPPASVLQVLAPPPLHASATPAEAIGRSLNPLPGGLPVLLDHARQLGADPTLLGEVSRLLDRDADLCPVLDQPAASAVVHSDLHFANLWWDHQAGLTMLDFEWVRAAPAYVELARIKDNADMDELDGLDEHRMLWRCLGDDYPELFEVDRLEARLRYLQVAFAVRELGIWPMPADEASTPIDHPLRRLQYLLS